MNPKRRIYVVDRHTQSQYVRHGMMVLMVGLLLGACNAYVLLNLLDALTSELARPGADWLSTALVVGHVLTAVAVNLGIVIILCLFYSHRLAGPTRKIGQALDQMAAGGLIRRLSLRDEDYLHELAERVNVLSDTWKGLLERIDTATTTLREHLPGDAQTLAAIDAIEVELAFYRTKRPPKEPIATGENAIVLG